MKPQSLTSSFARKLRYYIFLVVVGVVAANFFFVCADEDARYTEDELLINPEGTKGRFGNVVRVEGSHALVGAWFEDSQKGCVYAYRYKVVDGKYKWQYEQKLSEEGGKRFGTSVSIARYLDSGEWKMMALIGSPLSGTNSYYGQVYYYEYNKGTNLWSLEQIIEADERVAGGNFGASVAVSGYSECREDYICAVIGSPNAEKAYVFEKDIKDAFWGSFNQADVPLTTTSCTRTKKCNFGESVDIRGNMIAVGAPHKEGAAGYTERFWNGAVFMYTLPQYSYDWEEDGVLSNGGFRGHTFGTDVKVKNAATYGGALTVAVGAPESGTSEQEGRVYIYEKKSDRSWVDGKLIQATWEMKTQIINTGYINILRVEDGLGFADGEWKMSYFDPGFTSGGFGTSISFKSAQMNMHEDWTDVLVIGSSSKNNGGAYVITGNSTVPWTLTHAFAGKTSQGYFGASVDTNGDEIMIGCPLCNDYEGNVQTYKRDYSVHSSSSRKATGKIAGIVVGVVATFLIALVKYCCFTKKNEAAEENEQNSTQASNSRSSTTRYRRT